MLVQADPGRVEWAAAVEHIKATPSRIEDWLANFPSSGIRKMFAWEQYCGFAREPERRRVGVAVQGSNYEVEPDMAGEHVLLLCGLFDSELYVKYESVRTGPYYPVAGLIPMNCYRAFKRRAADARADRIRT